jgi:hypothetical protein
MDLASLGVLVSSIILSVGGCIAVTGEQFRRSRCTKINCSDCCQLDRDIESPRPTQVS